MITIEIIGDGWVDPRLLRVQRTRRGPLRTVCERLPDGRFVLACRHRVPPPSHVAASDNRKRARCCFCPSKPREKHDARWYLKRRAKERNQ